MLHCLGAIELDYFLFFVGQFVIEDLQDVSAFHYAGRLYCLLYLNGLLPAELLGFLNSNHR